MSTVKFEITANKVGVIKISRPEALNAMNRQVMAELKALVDQLYAKRELRAAVLTGDGEKAFVAGADIREFESLTPSQARELALNGQALFQRIEDLPFPVIAAVNGFALGGGFELALACDFIFASTKAKWGLPEVTLGLMPGYGGTQRLIRVVGRPLTKRIAMSGEMFTAKQGHEWGVFTELFEPEELFAKTMKVADILASRAPLALGWVKEAVHKGKEMHIDEGMKLEAELFARTFETKDRDEGVRAFIEKRLPVFQGK